MLKLNSKKLLMAALILFAANSLDAAMNPERGDYSRNRSRKNFRLSGTVSTPVKLIAAAATLYLAKKVYDNRETLKEKAKNFDSSTGNIISGTISGTRNPVVRFYDYLKTNLPGKWLVDGAKFGWNNKIATLATYLALDYYILESLCTKNLSTLNIKKEAVQCVYEINNCRFPLSATITTLLLCKLASVIEKYEAELAKKEAIKAEVKTEVTAANA